MLCVPVCLNTVAQEKLHGKTSVLFHEISVNPAVQLVLLPSSAIWIIQAEMSCWLGLTVVYKLLRRVYKAGVPFHIVVGQGQGDFIVEGNINHKAQRLGV